ncbi:hypothetical protein MPTK1_2g13920 [Marchantia polymorpha subsp. ruderalis]|uniref:Uncharacterized protein n=1 Tax=Marchantia polymorpha TaxID=3197 RepID=A0A2R6X1K2_MARPO|nr:hypothetical protein MARPO_0042s0021 [Marchantia polymorpha]BBN02269.1 hypothetical protein Mp_2g13920 [Marchantia polymorpha subsp. ruderalis]|eukprot:PTQ39970.1 hypothetical protein MARPO_0042s0021 [Marchantia polymorpha]
MDGWMDGSATAARRGRRGPRWGPAGLHKRRGLSPPPPGPTGPRGSPGHAIPVRPSALHRLPPAIPVGLRITKRCGEKRRDAGAAHRAMHWATGSGPSRCERSCVAGLASGTWTAKAKQKRPTAKRVVALIGELWAESGACEVDCFGRECSI